MKVINKPVPGYYKRRLVRGGPWVGVHVLRPVPIDPDTKEVLDRFWPLVAYQGDDILDPFVIWPYLKPIPEKEYLRLAGITPGRDEISPNEPMNLNTERSLF